MSALLAAARLGDRIAHGARIDDQAGEALLGPILGALAAAASTGGALAAAVGAGVAAGGGAGGAMPISTRRVQPTSTSGKVGEGSPDTFLGGPTLPAALAGAHPVSCLVHHDKPIRTGSATVFANRRRLSRLTDQTGCGAMLCDGEPTVLVGGATVDGAPPDPMILVSQGAALASVAVSTILTAGVHAVDLGVRWGGQLVHSARAEVDAVVASATVLEGELVAKVGALAGTAPSGALGGLVGALLGDRGK